MGTEIIRDRMGKIIGYIETTSTQVIGRDDLRRIVGTYRSTDNYTRDYNGKIVGPGNLLVGLVMNGRR